MRNSIRNTLLVHSIESFGTHDGPGIRLVVFLQGCNIACKYCHNPDTMVHQGGIITKIDEIVERAIRMKPYFGEKGGITISGGEPTLQAKAIIQLFEKLTQEKIHTNLDTNGTIVNQYTQKLITDFSDLVMFDVKSTTNQGFKDITGVEALENVLENIALRETSKKPYWLRYVLIPNYTDSHESLQWLITSFSRNEYLEKFEILPYHKLGLHKWQKLNLPYLFEHIEENTQEQLAKVKSILEPHFACITIN